MHGPFEKSSYLNFFTLFKTKLYLLTIKILLILENYKRKFCQIMKTLMKKDEFKQIISSGLFNKNKILYKAFMANEGYVK